MENQATTINIRAIPEHLEGRVLISRKEAEDLTGYGQSTVEMLTAPTDEKDKSKGGAWTLAGFVSRDTTAVRIYLPGLIAHLAGESGKDELRRRLETEVQRLRLENRGLRERLDIALHQMDSATSILRGLASSWLSREGA